MKKLFVVILALLLCATALAEGMQPRMYLAGCGLTVMDEAQIKAMGGDDSSFDLGGIDFSMAIVGGSEGSMPAIMFYDGSAAYVAFNMLAAFSGEAQDLHSLDQTFSDFCDAYDFEVYGYAVGDNQLYYVQDTETLEKLLALSPDNVPPEIYHDKADFFDAVRAASGK